MSKTLRKAYLKKEKAELFLSNLEKLKSEEPITDDQYRILKAEYTKMREDAIFKVNRIKARLKKKLYSKISELGPFKVKLDYLEARFKVGQIPANAYSKKEKGPKRKVSELEKQLLDLQALINSTCSADIGGSKGTNILGPDLSHRVNQLLELESAAMADTSVIETPGLKQSVPDIISITDLKIMPDRVPQGSSVGIVVTITNAGQSPLFHKVELKINGDVTDSSEVTLASGSSQEVTFVVIAGAPGDYQVDIDSATGKFCVMPAANTSD